MGNDLLGTINIFTAVQWDWLMGILVWLLFARKPFVLLFCLTKGIFTDFKISFGPNYMPPNKAVSKRQSQFSMDISYIYLTISTQQYCVSSTHQNEDFWHVQKFGEQYHLDQLEIMGLATLLLFQDDLEINIVTLRFYWSAVLQTLALPLGITRKLRINQNF